MTSAKKEGGGSAQNHDFKILSDKSLRGEGVRENCHHFSNILICILMVSFSMSSLDKSLLNSKVAQNQYYYHIPNKTLKVESNFETLFVYICHYFTRREGGRKANHLSLFILDCHY